MELLPNIHPGEVLQEEFLAEFNLTAYRLAQDVGIPQTRLSEILKRKRRITADTALRLGRYFGNSPKFWLGLQNDYDLEEAQRTCPADFERIPPFTQKAAA
ncbi:MAG: HigA family addiction module antitoxin [Hymenobacter sp.]